MYAESLMYSADGLALKQYGCTYLGPDYDPRTHRGVTPYCGCKDLVKDTLYCEEHYALMYVKGSALRKRHKDTRRADAVRLIESLFNEAVAELEAEGFDFDLKPVDEELV
jgi:hypothetical protein